MNVAPVVGNLLTSADPNLVVLLHIIEETLQRAEAARAPQQAAVHPDGHHLRRAGPLGVQHVEAVFQIGVKLLGSIEPLGGGKAHIVGVEGIRYDQVRLTRPVAAGHLAPERQIVAIIVAVVIKTAVLHHQLAGMGAIAPGIPAGGRFAKQIG